MSMISIDIGMSNDFQMIHIFIFGTCYTVQASLNAQTPPDSASHIVAQQAWGKTMLSD